MIADEFAPAVHAFVEIIVEENAREWIVLAQASIRLENRIA